MTDQISPPPSDEELIEKYIEHPKRRLRLAAMTLAQSAGVVIDDIERAAIDAINAEYTLEQLILALAWAEDSDGVRDAWHTGLRQWFNRENYRLEIEVRRFAKQREQAYAEAAAQNAALPAPSPPR